MGFNYAHEKKIFDAEWALTEKEYIAAGMSSEAIEAMRSFDWDFFKLRRNAAIHEQKLVGSSFDDDADDESHSALFVKFLESLSISDENSSNHSRLWWIDEISNSELSAKIKNLSVSQVELLTLIVCDGFSQAEIARTKGITRQSLNEQIQRIKKIINIS